MKRIVYNLFFIIFVVVCMSTVKLDAQAEIYWNTAGEKTPQGEDYVSRYWNGRSWVYNGVGRKEIPKRIDVTYKVKYCYEEAYKMIDLVNAERRKAGVPELVAKDELMDAAMMRAAETIIYLDHIRPDGSSYSSASLFIDGENIDGGGMTAQEATQNLVNSSGHYATMINERYAYAGYGYVEVYEDSICVASSWVQNFSVANKYYEDGYDREHPENNKPVEWEKMTLGNRKDYIAKFTAKVNPAFLSLKARLEYYENILSGNEINIDVEAYTTSTRQGTTSCYLSYDQYDVKVLTPSICSYQNGKVKGLKAGKAKLLISLKADNSINTTVEFDIKDKPVKNGSSYTVSGNTYKVTSTGNKTVEFQKADDSQNSVSIPKTVKIKGKTYKVTAIAANAFKDNKNIKAVTVPANITKIGKNAFYGCKNLKKVTVKTTKLTSSKVGKNAFKGIHKKAVIKVPGKKLGTYKKLFKAKGVGKQVKIKK